MRYQVGTKFTDRQGRECEVVDFLTTRNMAGEVVKTTYVTAHTLMGQRILDRDVCETTIAKALWNTTGKTAA